ncbi:MAG: helix-turn-helix transcriptional regulator [Gammaproteobacteria bacterium]|nr:helix-turn-helix transcriptional regulator [Gammaproteobacteria bacterium]
MQALQIDESTLAKACNISLASLSRIKNNPDSNPTISTLRPLADFFNITIDQLLGYSPLDNNIANIKQVPVIPNTEIFTWLNNKTSNTPIEQWLIYNQSISDLTFATNYKLDNTNSVLQNCLILIDPKRELQHDDLIFIYNNKIKQFFLRLISIDDQNKIYLRPIESGFSDYVLLDNCKNNLSILGVVIESRLQYKVF